ncbi:hypothetical protein K491DRAFT_716044 [Lophiostoma macrostomum CBS 122681]|uniref:Uncharacterized protein n=1 Tax=Lophiostoma macrostomum CBS 122681 TaxID=1314788 RepID=A0A6A6T7D0_9PLEO|nr:hypothetical protein K491DRAFT_716044 [Lophiostoma macrostomum CBS 122681]
MSSEPIQAGEGSYGMPTTPPNIKSGHRFRSRSLDPKAATFQLSSGAEAQCLGVPMNDAKNFHQSYDEYHSSGSDGYLDASAFSSPKGRYDPDQIFSPATTNEHGNWNMQPLFNPEQQYWGYSYSVNPVNGMMAPAADGTWQQQGLTHGVDRDAHGYPPQVLGPNGQYHYPIQYPGYPQSNSNDQMAWNQDIFQAQSNQQDNWNASYPQAHLNHHEGWHQGISQAPFNHHTAWNQNHPYPHFRCHPEMHPNGELSDSRHQASNYSPAQNGNSFRYPNPDDIRADTDLMGIACAIPLSRRQNALSGKGLNVLEERIEERVAERTVNGIPPSTILFHNLPKKALILFCGRKTVSRFLRTLEREDNENWIGLPTRQQLRVPPGSCNFVGLLIFLDWVRKACDREYAHTLRPIQCPVDMFSAISLARTLRLFGLKKDAERIDNSIRARLSHHPLHPHSVEEIWKAFPKDCKYTYRMVKCLKEQVEMHRDIGSPFVMPKAEEMFAVIDKYPHLKDRIEIVDENEKFKPVSADKWAVRHPQAPEFVLPDQSTGLHMNQSDERDGQISGLAGHMNSLSLADPTSEGTVAHAQAAHSQSPPEQNDLNADADAQVQEAYDEDSTMRRRMGLFRQHYLASGDD